MKKILIYIFLLPLTINAKDNLYDFCQKQNGQIKRFYICPKTKIPLPVRTCEFKNEYGEREFVNGCSGPSGGYKDIFFMGCIQHDLCYHHEPATNGYSQKKCDLDLLEYSLNACEVHASKTLHHCKKWARIMYRALRVIGKPAFYCENVNRNKIDPNLDESYFNSYNL